jgi:ubiquinol-cytochrome c reductase iron-sulfur subunit
MNKHAEDNHAKPGGVMGLLYVISTFSIAGIAGVAFLIAYWTHGNNLLLGGTMAIGLGSLGASLVVWAHRLMRHEEITVPRKPLPSCPRDCAALTRDLISSEHEVKRRSLLGWMVALVLGVFSLDFLSLARSFGKSPMPVLMKAAWIRGQRLVNEQGLPVSKDALQVGSTVTVFPEGQVGSLAAQTVLLRVEENLLKLPKERASWAPSGNLAYSRICTHAGCPVGLYETSKHLLLCPCHQSTFDVLASAKPTSGPAARPLPQLPLYVDQEGNLCAGGDFNQRPGPGFWELPS